LNEVELVFHFLLLFSNSNFIQTTLVQEISRLAYDLSLHIDFQLFVPYEKRNKTKNKHYFRPKERH